MDWPGVTKGPGRSSGAALARSVVLALSLILAATSTLAAVGLSASEPVRTGAVPCGVLGSPRPICGPGSIRSFAGAQTPMWVNVTSSSPQSPPLDYWASMAYDPQAHEFVLFGGCQDRQCPSPAQTWTFSHGAWLNVTGTSIQPPARSYATFDYDSADGYLVLFGGVGSSVLGDTWVFSGGQWTNRTGSTGPSPPARWGANVAYDPVEHGILLFGGMSAQGAFLNDTWIYSAGSWHARTPTVAPPGRYEASMAWDAVDSEVVLVYGCSAVACPLHDAWRFQNQIWSPLPEGSGPTPGARFLSAMTYDGVGSTLRLFGGIGTGTSLGDTWQYAAGTWRQLNLSGAPRAREGSAVAESTEVWLPNGTPAISPFEVLWGGDWVDCAMCRLQGLEDTWVFEVPPQVSVSPLGAPAVPGAASGFQGLASGGTPPFSYSWNFGDGGTAAGPNVTHAFASPGQYQVSLVVRDDAGAKATNTYAVTVAAQPGSFSLAEGLGVGLVSALGVAILAMWIRARRRPPAT